MQLHVTGVPWGSTIEFLFLPLVSAPVQGRRLVHALLMPWRQRGGGEGQRSSCTAPIRLGNGVVALLQADRLSFIASCAVRPRLGRRSRLLATVRQTSKSELLVLLQLLCEKNRNKQPHCWTLCSIAALKQCR
jgi:hypothetical protein